MLCGIGYARTLEGFDMGAFTIDYTNWQLFSNLQQLNLGVAERVLASKNETIYDDTSSHSYAKFNLRGYEGVMYTCITAHTATAFDPTKWHALEVEDGSDVQATDFFYQDSLYWYGWNKMQDEISGMASDFVKEIHLLKYQSYPGGFAFNWIERYTFTKLTIEIHGEDSSLFSDPSQPDGVSHQFTRTLRVGGVITTLHGACIAGDFIDDIMIREIVACLEKLKQTYLSWASSEYDARVVGSSAASPNAVCNTGRNAHRLAFAGSLDRSIMETRWRCK